MASADAIVGPLGTCGGEVGRKVGRGADGCVDGHTDE